MSHRFGVFLLVALVLAGSVRVSLAQDDFFGQTVVSVTFDVEGRPDVPDSVAALSDVKVGQPLRRQDVRSTTARLDSLGRYDGIAVDATAVPGGVAVTWRLEPKHPITGVAVRGDTGISAGAIEARVRQRFGAAPAGVRLSSVEASVVSQLHDEGYLDAAATATTEVTHAPEAATLVVTVKAGPQTVIGRTDVRGDSPIAASEVIARTGTAAGRPYRRRSVEAALGAIEDELRGRGFYEAQASLQMQDRTAAGVELVITVVAGRRVEVRIEPPGSLPGDVNDLVPLRRLGSADQDLLEDSRAQIERLLRAQGYWRASAPFSRVVDEAADRLVITFTISRGPKYFVSSVDLPATLAVPADAVRKLIGFEPGAVFDEARFRQGVEAVLETYRRGGYYAAKAEPSVEDLGASASAARAEVVLHPNITEGPQGHVAAVVFSLGAGAPLTEAALRSVMVSRPGSAYVFREAALDRAAIERLYNDRGFRRARVEVRPTLADDGRAVTLNVTVDPGAEIRIGQISIVGNEGVSEREILDALQLKVGAPASVTAITEAEARLNDLGVFRRASISSIDQFTDPLTQLVVNVVEAPKTTVAYGAGVEGGRFTRTVASGGTDDLLEFAPRGSFEVTRRNIGGRNRSASLFSRVTLKREREDVDKGGFGFTEYRVSGTFRERNVLRTKADLVFGLTSEQAVRTTYNFIRQSGNLEVYRPVTRQLSVSGRYNLEFTKLFDQRFCTVDDPASCDDDFAIIDRVFPQVRLSVLSLGGAWDRRDKPLTPTRGTYVTADLEGAFRKIGSQVGYVKGFVQASAYRRLDAGGRSILAVRAELGAANGFARTAIRVDDDGQEVVETVDDLPASKRFFAGGSTTVRGFQLDRLAVPELLNRGNLPLGGNGLVVMNGEFRRYLTKLFGRDLGGVAFLDAGNVFRRANDIDLGRLRAGAGFGIRYDSPLGPLRLDFGFKLKPVVLNGTRERGWEYHLSIGEAF